MNRGLKWKWKWEIEWIGRKNLGRLIMTCTKPIELKENGPHNNGLWHDKQNAKQTWNQTTKQKKKKKKKKLKKLFYLEFRTVSYI